MKRVLVIKLAALGDFVQATGPMRRIRVAHPQARITLLTTLPYAGLGAALGLFDDIWDDGRPNDLRGLLALARRLRAGRFERVYDLQTSDRSSSYRRLFWPRPPQWSGVAAGASHPHANPNRDAMHTLERQADQLMHAGVWPDAPIEPGAAPAPDLSNLADPSGVARLGVQASFALLIPGASPLRPGKRWPREGYVVLAKRLAETGLRPVIVGGPAEAEDGAAIVAQEPRAMDLAGRTSFADLAALGAQASLAVGADTGPSHLIAAAGAPTLVLFSGESDPVLCAPRGRRVEVLRRDSLSDLDPETVIERALIMATTGRPTAG